MGSTCVTLRSIGDSNTDRPTPIPLARSGLGGGLLFPSYSVIGSTRRQRLVCLHHVSFSHPIFHQSERPPVHVLSLRAQQCTQALPALLQPWDKEFGVQTFKHVTPLSHASILPIFPECTLCVGPCHAPWGGHAESLSSSSSRTIKGDRFAPR